MSDADYCYPPDYTVLKNRLGLRDADHLDRAERRLVTQRALEPLPIGDFDLAHLRALHHHLFQDVFEWAGDLRTVEISKGGSQFQFRQYIETGMTDVHRRITAHNYLRNLPADQFADLAGEILGDINYVHPFREGNGRTQLYFYKQLAEQAGHAVDLTQIEAPAWMDASRQAHEGNYAPMASCLSQTLAGRSRGHGDPEEEPEHD
ncbi:Fic family protein [Sulfitobacter mediterraneus]|uniref:Fic/DOC family protein n=1 Tax=Sulfitobacter mediterraneus TaxID=83219 RepID=UPI00193A3FD2|nr:Fic family protein [Sulfitobacter mediterraneus]MBM1556230.1 Fic family protein [Sulfitobacter mediterraneus]MBM1567732.1 Fic family protein [Sulfitobacter mediterraneus]MBM1571584.1 Fic family protein [Sulfitobacter mediterraneus]MBM1575372.1 Fic family protein [Sulfitobacter mediterraneus]MBM1579137.1 Fic family protein [Sulfitobacter mediterraneus]